jgi:hypothetical protein
LLAYLEYDISKCWHRLKTPWADCVFFSKLKFPCESIFPVVQWWNLILYLLCMWKYCYTILSSVSMLPDIRVLLNNCIPCIVESKKVAMNVEYNCKITFDKLLLLLLLYFHHPCVITKTFSMTWLLETVMSVERL